MHVWVEKVECPEFADGRKIHQQALALIGLHVGQIHCQRSSSLWLINHAYGLVLLDEMTDVSSTEELRAECSVVKEANHGDKQHGRRACVERNKGTKCPKLGTLPNGVRCIFKGETDVHTIQEDKLQQLAGMLAEMERNTSEAVGVSDHSEEEEEEEAAGRKIRSDWNKTSDSRNFEGSVVSTEPTEKTAKDEDMPQ